MRLDQKCEILTFLWDLTFYVLITNISLIIQIYILHDKNIQWEYLDFIWPPPPLFRNKVHIWDSISFFLILLIYTKSGIWCAVREPQPVLQIVPKPSDPYFFRGVVIHTFHIIFYLLYLTQAMAETVGSIMTNHTGKGRYLTPENFSKELYLGEYLVLSVIYQALRPNPLLPRV